MLSPEASYFLLSLLCGSNNSVKNFLDFAGSLELVRKWCAMRLAALFLRMRGKSYLTRDVFGNRIHPTPRKVSPPFSQISPSIRNEARLFPSRPFEKIAEVRVSGKRRNKWAALLRPVRR